VNREQMNINSLWTKVVKGDEGWSFVQVIENEEKIKLEKCPKHHLRYDIMVL
jgi:hypothetical protein